MFNTSTQQRVVLLKETSYPMLTKLFDRTNDALDNGTPEDINNLIASIKNLLSVMSTNEEK